MRDASRAGTTTAALSCLAVSVLLVSSCGAVELGTAAPVDAPAAIAPGGSGGPAATSAAGGAPGAGRLASLDPCELFTGDELRDVGLDPASGEYSSVLNSCDFLAAERGDPGVIVDVAVGEAAESLNLDQYTVVDISVGGLRGYRITDDIWCQVILSSDSAGYVSLGAESETSTAACDVIDPLAESVAATLSAGAP
ncbi:DUF3558 family protein [Actinoalloteichus caeruleus]|uniref:DUF3558 family protein n=1 Tax=Actinoalloteichus cyanogriseus TaxID=2893586 RepID=UPI0004ABA23F|nr:DUF3558 family protein [Actinoalloteichus caeruleus]